MVCDAQFPCELTSSDGGLENPYQILGRTSEHKEKSERVSWRRAFLIDRRVN